MLPRPDLSISESMPNSQRRIKVREARAFLAQQQFEQSKRQILNALINYADAKLANPGLFSPPHHDRFRLYSNIMQQADKLDALHFAHYVVLQLSGVDEYFTQSTLKQNVLPVARQYRDAYIAPEIARTQKAAAGLVVGGISLMATGYMPATGISMMALGMAVFPFADQIVLARLNRSLQLKHNKALLTAGSRVYAIDDGMNDELTQIFGTSSQMLSTGATLFGRLGQQMDRAARIGMQSQPSLAGANGGPIIEEVDDEPRQRNVPRG